MEQDRPMGKLYDFLYRDSGRITSYYAQLFGDGQLTSLEKTDTVRGGTDKAAKAGVGVVSGDVRYTSENTEASKRVFSPHDLVTTDVLTKLMRQQRVYQNPVAAPHGALILAQGTVGFIDRHMTELAASVFDSLISHAGVLDEAGAQALKVLAGFLSKLPLPSAFLLQMADGVQVAGTIKDAGMEEPISAYYFKHGTAGLANVYVIGVKEIPSESSAMPNTQLIGAGQQVAQGLSDMLFPKEAIRAGPFDSRF